jgi:hypothetical protein
MITNKKKLLKALNLVLKHKEEIDRGLWEGIHLNALDIQKGNSSKENLKKWFILMCGPAVRGGPPPSLEKRRKMIKVFDRWYKKIINDILPNFRGQKAIDKMIEELVKIKGIGYKIASVYLRDIIYHFEAWPHLKDYLYLPIDRHTKNIILYKIKAFKENEVPNIGESYFTPKNRQFQKILNQIHKPRVEFDYFWIIGSCFCSYYLCDFCWIRKFCQAKLSILKH